MSCMTFTNIHTCRSLDGWKGMLVAGWRVSCRRRFLGFFCVLEVIEESLSRLGPRPGSLTHNSWMFTHSSMPSAFFLRNSRSCRSRLKRGVVITVTTYVGSSTHIRTLPFWDCWRLIWSWRECAHVFLLFWCAWYLLFRLFHSLLLFQSFR